MTDTYDLNDSLNSASQTVLDIAGMYDSMLNYKQNREDARWYYEDQKLWNSPANQMKLRLAAGLNPYGEFTTNSVGAPSPITSSVPESIQAMSDHLSLRSQRKLERAAQRLSYKQILLEEKKVDNDTVRAEKQAQLLSSQITYQDILNSVQSYLSANAVRISDEELSSHIINNGILAKTFQNFDSLSEAQLNNLVASTANMSASASLSNQQKKRLETLLPYEEKEFQNKDSNMDIQRSVNELVDSFLPKDSKPGVRSGVKLFLLILIKKAFGL